VKYPAFLLKNRGEDDLSKEGKIFEESLENSSKKQGIFSLRIKDTHIPTQFRKLIRVSKNKYDFILFSSGHLLPIELKSTKAKSISMKEDIIKSHQIKSLEEALEYDNTIPGFVFNFREPNNKTYFVHIRDFVTYKNIAENQLDHTYKNKVNRSSIPIAICEEIGIEIKNELKRTRYFYDVKEFIGKAVSQ
jgi:penicillin-binding protein-related factor A (putative recombinase)